MTVRKIRLLADSALHHAGAELTVVDTDAVAAHAKDSVTLAHAITLVEKGQAELVVESPAPVSPDEPPLGVDPDDAQADEAPAGRVAVDRVGFIAASAAILMVFVALVEWSGRLCGGLHPVHDATVRMTDSNPFGVGRCTSRAQRSNMHVKV
jgi:hypothetical protein